MSNRVIVVVIAGFVSTVTVILPGFQILFVITRSSLQRGSTAERTSVASDPRGTLFPCKLTLRPQFTRTR